MDKEDFGSQVIREIFDGSQVILGKNRTYALPSSVYRAVMKWAEVGGNRLFGPESR